MQQLQRNLSPSLYSKPPPSMQASLLTHPASACNGRCHSCEAADNVSAYVR